MDPEESKKRYEELRKLGCQTWVFNSDFCEPHLAGEVSLGIVSGNLLTWHAKKAQRDWTSSGQRKAPSSDGQPGDSSRCQETPKRHIRWSTLLRPENAAKIALWDRLPGRQLKRLTLFFLNIVEDKNVFPPQSVMDNGVWQDEDRKRASFKRRVLPKT